MAYADLRNVRASIDVEQEVIQNEERRALLTVLKTLTKEERRVLRKIAYKNESNLSNEERRILSKIRFRLRGCYPP